MGCFASKPLGHCPGNKNLALIAEETPFSIDELEALCQLYKKMSSLITKDGFIHKEEFQLALFRDKNHRNFFADRIFDLFDYNCDGVIDFREFVTSMAVFHPNAPFETKVAFSFRLHDLRSSGYIERAELREMLSALLHESTLELPEDVVELIVDNSFSQADVNGDGRIDLEEWKAYVSKNPSLISNLTLPYLKQMTLVFPSFLAHHQEEDPSL